MNRNSSELFSTEFSTFDGQRLLDFEQKINCRLINLLIQNQ